MQTRYLLLVPFLALAAAPLACGGAGDTAASGSTGTGGAAATTTSSGTSMSATTGAGGDTSSTSTASSMSSGSTTAASGTGGGSGCVGFIDVTENNEAKLHFGSICAGDNGSAETMTAVGYHFAGGAFPGADELRIDGCSTTAQGSPGLRLRTSKAAANGTFTDGDASYTDASSTPFSTAGDPYSVVITKFDPPGGVIEGTFAATVTGPTDGKKTLTGTFHVCHVKDELVP